MFFHKCQSIGARIHKTKGICVELIVRKCSHHHMNTHFRRFKMLALQTMAGEELKNDDTNATSCF